MIYLYWTCETLFSMDIPKMEIGHGGGGGEEWKRFDRQIFFFFTLIERYSGIIFTIYAIDMFNHLHVGIIVCMYDVNSSLYLIYWNKIIMDYLFIYLFIYTSDCSFTFVCQDLFIILFIIDFVYSKSLFSFRAHVFFYFARSHFLTSFWFIITYPSRFLSNYLLISYAFVYLFVA